MAKASREAPSPQSLQVVRSHHERNQRQQLGISPLKYERRFHSNDRQSSLIGPLGVFDFTCASAETLNLVECKVQ